MINAPACHYCEAPAIVEITEIPGRGDRLVDVSWQHEPGCPVLEPGEERDRLNEALVVVFS